MTIDKIKELEQQYGVHEDQRKELVQLGEILSKYNFLLQKLNEEYNRKRQEYNDALGLRVPEVDNAG